MVALLILAALFWGALSPLPLPADAAHIRPHFKGTVQIWYQVSKQWDVPKAVKASGITGYRLKKITGDDDPLRCNERKSRQCLMVWSYEGETVNCSPPVRNAGPSEVCLYRGGNPVRSGRLTDSSIDLSDTSGLTKAQRHALLTAEFRKALPR